jgi:hypothetical protein
MVWIQKKLENRILVWKLERQFSKLYQLGQFSCSRSTFSVLHFFPRIPPSIAPLCISAANSIPYPVHPTRLNPVPTRRPCRCLPCAVGHPPPHSTPSPCRARPCLHRIPWRPHTPFRNRLLAPYLQAHREFQPKWRVYPQLMKSSSNPNWRTSKLQIGDRIGVDSLLRMLGT